MTIDLNTLFQYKIANQEKLLHYGFFDNGQEFIKEVPIMNNQFTMTITIKDKNIINFIVIDNESGEEYALVHIKSAHGNFVGDVRTACENELNDIAEKCFDIEILKAEQTKRIISSIANMYNVEPEFLWAKSPDSAVFRRKDNEKWFAIIMNVDKSRLGIEGSGTIEIIDLKTSPDIVESLLTKENYYPAYHMNKKHWFTISLDGSVTDEVLFSLLASSYECSGKK